MGSIVDNLTKRGLISPPPHLKNNIMYEVITGSVAYHVSTDTSDMDVIGFTIPHKDIIFPHLAGEIPGFGRQIKRFEQYQQHHIKDKEYNKEYDITIYNIVKYFQLCMENNPNMIDTLFVSQDCVLHCTHIGNILRQHSRRFLHRGCYYKFSGYANSQLHKIRTKHESAKYINEFEIKHNIDHNITVEEFEEVYKDKIDCNIDDKIKYIKCLNNLYENGYKRAQLVREHGFDYKFAYHVIRLLDEGEQILLTGDLELGRNREELKSIRRGEWTFEKLLERFNEREKSLKELYDKSTIKYGPDERFIKNILLNCLEEHFGTLDNAIIRDDEFGNLKREFRQLCTKYKI